MNKVYKKKKCAQFAHGKTSGRDEWHKAGTLGGWILSFAGIYLPLDLFFARRLALPPRRETSQVRLEMAASLFSETVKPTDPPRHAIHRASVVNITTNRYSAVCQPCSIFSSKVLDMRGIVASYNN